MIILPNGNVEILGNLKVDGILDTGGIQTLTTDYAVPEMGSRIWKIRNGNTTEAITLGLSEGKTLKLQPGKIIEITMIDGHHAILSRWEYEASGTSEQIPLLPPKYLPGGAMISRSTYESGDITFTGTESVNGKPQSSLWIREPRVLFLTPMGSTWSLRADQSVDLTYDSVFYHSIENPVSGGQYKTPHYRDHVPLGAKCLIVRIWMKKKGNGSDDWFWVVIDGKRPPSSGISSYAVGTSLDNDGEHFHSTIAIPIDDDSDSLHIHPTMFPNNTLHFIDVSIVGYM